MSGKEFSRAIEPQSFSERSLGPIKFHLAAPMPQANIVCSMLVTEPSLIQIAAGWFSMGSDTGQDVEGPVHRVWVDSFAMASTQVTVAEYARFLDATGSMPPPTWNDANFRHPQQPVAAVSWFDSVAYCAWLSEMAGAHYRLPTEAEWERAARGGAEGMAFPWGDDPPVSRPDYQARWKTGPEPVAQSEPNAFGLFEMCENVHEWCSDWFGRNTIRFHLIGIRAGRKMATAKYRAEVPGGTTSRSHDVRRVPAFRRNLNTQIMASESFAVAKQQPMCNPE